MPDLYHKIGQVLFDISPDRSVQVRMHASLSDDGSACEFQFEYMDEKERGNWFLGGAKANAELTDLLNLLRIETEKKDNSIWSSIDFAIDLKTGKFTVEFTY